jgi:hypothetical protein
MPDAPESRCPRCPARLLRQEDGTLTCHGGCVLHEADFPPGGLFMVELWFTVTRRQNLRRLVAEKRRRGLPLAISPDEATRAWNAPPALPPAVQAPLKARGLHIED